MPICKKSEFMFCQVCPFSGEDCPSWLRSTTDKWENIWIGFFLKTSCVVLKMLKRKTLPSATSTSSPGWYHPSFPMCCHCSPPSWRPSSSSSCIYLTSLCWHRTLLPFKPPPPHRQHQGPVCGWGGGGGWRGRRKGRGRDIHSPADLQPRLLVTVTSGDRANVKPPSGSSLCSLN